MKVKLLLLLPKVATSINQREWLNERGRGRIGAGVSTGERVRAEFS